MNTYRISLMVDVTIPAFTKEDALEVTEDAIKAIEALGGAVENSKVISVEENN